MKIIIEGNELTSEEIDIWKKKHAIQAFRNLHLSVPKIEDTVLLCEELTNLKCAMSYEELIAPLHVKLKLGGYAMKIAAKFAGKKRKRAITTLYAKGINAATFSQIVDSLMLEDTPHNRKINLAACPEHYALVARGDTLEVVEKVGCCPVPTQFFITYNDETGLITARDTSYPYQSVGIAKLKNGTVIGGIRHQFRDTEEGLEVRTVVEFPAMCPTYIVRDHQKHLAVEWSSWIEYAISQQ